MFHKIDRLLNLKDILDKHYYGLKIGNRNIFDGDMRIIFKFINETDSMYQQCPSLVKNLSKVGRNISDTFPKRINETICDKMIHFLMEGLTSIKQDRIGKIYDEKRLEAHMYRDLSFWFGYKFENSGEIAYLVTSADLHSISSDLSMENVTTDIGLDEEKYIKSGFYQAGLDYLRASEIYKDKVTKHKHLLNASNSFKKGGKFLISPEDGTFDLKYATTRFNTSMNAIKSFNSLKQKEKNRIPDSHKDFEYDVELANSVISYLDLALSQANQGYAFNNALNAINLIEETSLKEMGEDEQVKRIASHVLDSNSEDDDPAKLIILDYL